MFGCRLKSLLFGWGAAAGKILKHLRAERGFKSRDDK